MCLIVIACVCACQSCFNKRIKLIVVYNSSSDFNSLDSYSTGTNDDCCNPDCGCKPDDDLLLQTTQRLASLLIAPPLYYFLYVGMATINASNIYTVEVIYNNNNSDVLYIY